MVMVMMMMVMMVMMMMVMTMMVIVMMVMIYIYLNHCQPVIVAAKLKFMYKNSISRRDSVVLENYANADILRVDWLDIPLGRELREYFLFFHLGEN